MTNELKVRFNRKIDERCSYNSGILSWIKHSCRATKEMETKDSSGTLKTL